VFCRSFSGTLPEISPVNGFVTDEVGALGLAKASGQYALNAYEDQRLVLDAGGLVSGTSYYVYVVRGSDGYGRNPQSFTYSGRGYEDVDIALRYGEGPTNPPGEIIDTSAADNGAIYETRIIRNSPTDPHIKLTWLYRAGSGVTSADIWRRSGDVATAFSMTTSNWTKINPTSVALTEYIDSNMAFNNNLNAYYRVVPSGTTADQIFGTITAGGSTMPRNNRTVGKIDVNLSANALKLVSLPLNAGAMSAILASQTLSGGMAVYPQSSSGGGLNVLSFAGGVLSGDFNVRPTVGFWIRNDGTPKTLTFAGSFETAGQKVLAYDLDLNGNPIPYVLNSTAIGGQTGDVIYPPTSTGGGLDVSANSAGSWSSTFSIGLASGFWYRKSGSRFWNIDLYRGTATISQP
jgi:hypothetical protein